VDDISLGGMAFHYFHWEERAKDTKTIDLVRQGGATLAQKIPYELVGEKITLKQFTFGFYKVKECRVQFSKEVSKYSLNLQEILDEFRIEAY